MKGDGKEGEEGGSARSFRVSRRRRVKGNGKGELYEQVLLLAANANRTSTGNKQGRKGGKEGVSSVGTRGRLSEGRRTNFEAAMFLMGSLGRSILAGLDHA